MQKLQNKKNLVGRGICYVALAFITFITLLPLIWMLSASLKLETDVFTVPIQWIPSNPQWSNYTKIWEKIPLSLFTFNSIKLTVIITIIQLITSSFAAYGFSKCKFRGRDTLFLCYVATIAIPWQVYMLPQYIMMNKMQLIDTHLSIILLQSFVAFGVFLIRQFYVSIPNELLEAARIDGLSEYGIYFRIVLPLTKPALATLTIFSFVNVWNDFMGPMIYFNSTKLKTIQLGIRMFIGQYSAEYGLIMAASVVSLIPVIAVFLAFQRFFIEGVATSGLKG
ncbi:MAG: carbohydrate ABC transporter permease [Oscillospiraceae bacterium]|nr:carbohydrate ABC transporter permease [Oscillospiraceae bacterium]